MKPNQPRRPLDAYYSPDDLAAALVSVLPIQEGAQVLEPHVGGGAFARALLRRPLGWLTVADIDAKAPGLDEWANRARVADFLACTQREDWVIGNPPFEGFERHVDKALEVAPDVAFLLRTATMSSAGRIAYWKRWPLRATWVLAERPSFTGDGRVDRYDYSWFWFSRAYPGPAVVYPGWSWRQPTTSTSPRPASGPAPAEDKPQPRAVGGRSSGLSSRTARATSTGGLVEGTCSPTYSAEAL